MPDMPFKSRTDLDAMIDEIAQRLELLHRASVAASRAQVWSNLTVAVLRLAAPEDHEHVYERLNAIFKAHASRQTASLHGDGLPVSHG
jgi:hypothetical protein